MRAKDYLSQIRLCKIRLAHLQEEEATIRSEIEGLRGIVYDKDKIQTSTQGDQMLDGIIRLMDIRVKIASRIAQVEELQLAIITEIHGLNDSRYEEVLYDVYVKLMPLGQVADAMGYEYSYICHLHGDALQAFNEKYLKDDIK